jgi:hypothetical protein
MNTNPPAKGREGLRGHTYVDYLVNFGCHPKATAERIVL